MISFKKMDQHQQQVLLLGVLIICIVLVLYFQILLKPMVSHLGQLFSSVRSVRGEVLTSKDEMTRVDSLKRRVKDLEEKLTDYQKAIPAESDLSQILGYLSSEAKAARISLVGVEPIQEELAASIPFRMVRLRVRAKGGYHPLGIFLNRLENGDRFVGIDAFDISADSVSPTEHSIELYLRTYVAGAKN